MYHETEIDRHWAIPSMNCNKSDLYGMLRSNDPALKSRFVICEYKPNDLSKQEWEDVKKKYIKNPVFAYSFK
jgi:hypothetical protein